MLIGFAHPFIFVANLKTASTAIEAALRPYSDIALVEARFGKHLPMCLIEDRFDWIFEALPFGDFFTFGVMREPADLLVSLYNSHSDAKFKDDPALYTGDIDFDVFLNEWTKIHLDQVVPQYIRFLTGYGQIGAKYIVSYGRLCDGMKTVADAICAPELQDLPVFNISPRRISRDRLSRAQLGWIRRRFADDYHFIKRYCDRLLDDVEQQATAATYGRLAADTFELTAASRKTRWEGMLVRAVYRTFLGRDPDPAGFRDALGQLRSGRSIEEVFAWCLGSEEFGAAHRNFIRAHVDRRFLDQAEGAAEGEAD